MKKNLNLEPLTTAEGSKFKFFSDLKICCCKLKVFFGVLTVQFICIASALKVWPVFEVVICVV